MLLSLSSGFLMAQHSVVGKIVDDAGEVVISASIIVEGTNRGVLSDLDGSYKINAPSSTASLTVSYLGYKTQVIPIENRTEINITLVSGIDIGEIQVVGSRSYKRSAINSAVAVDVIEVNDIQTRNGQVEVNQILQYVAPSFNATKQSGSDGADHVDPATLRGLGPDQTLVLINGKRRHQSSLINVFGSRGRGNTGTDLNAIPVASIERIEVLRDGASAQYGSDAIAGVINIVLKDDVNKLTGNLTYGAYNTNAKGDWTIGTANAGGTNRLYDEDRNLDGNSVQLATNYGFKIGEKGGFANITTQLLSKQRTLRPGADFRKGYGEAAISGFSFMLNSAVPLSDKTEFYVFGGRNYRDTDAYAFTRNNPTARNVVSIYPKGFTPRITSIISDASVSAGVRHNLQNNWSVDFNNTYGKNDFHYTIKNTLNASLEEASPTAFDAGGHSLAQNTTGVGFNKYFETIGLNVAFGTEYRTENFIIFAGEQGSYTTYDENGLPVVGPGQVIPIDSITGEERPGSSQGFPGYSPLNEVDKDRSNLGFYVDAEYDITKAFLLSAAVRFENYSDFGKTLNYKIASRYSFSDNVAIRASASSGFRAPSLAQIYYNLRFTNFVGGTPQEVLLSPNNSPVTRGFGIQELKQEEAANYSAGITFNSGLFTLTVDGYIISVKDRIVLTEYFDATSLGLNVSAAQFFANGLDTKTQGLDVVLNYRKEFGDNNLNIGLTGNINKLEVLTVNSGNLDPNVFFGPREQYFLAASAPPYKFGFNLAYSTPKISIAFAATQFSEVTLLDWQMYEDDADYGGYAAKLDAARDIYEARTVVDLSFRYNITEKLNFTIGGNNIFNAYPTVQDDWTDSGGYWDSVQMGTSGAYYYARIGFNF